MGHSEKGKSKELGSCNAMLVQREETKQYWEFSEDQSTYYVEKIEERSSRSDQMCIQEDNEQNGYTPLSCWYKLQ